MGSNPQPVGPFATTGLLRGHITLEYKYYLLFGEIRNQAETSSLSWFCVTTMLYSEKDEGASIFSWYTVIQASSQENTIKYL